MVRGRRRGRDCVRGCVEPSTRHIGTANFPHEKV